MDGALKPLNELLRLHAVPPRDLIQAIAALEGEVDEQLIEDLARLRMLSEQMVGRDQLIDQGLRAS